MRRTVDERHWAQTRALRARGSSLPPGAPLGQDILDSWARCVEAGLDFATAPPTVVVEAPDLRRRREQAQAVRRLALAELETLFHQIAGSNFLLAFADRDGVILDLYADNRFATSAAGEPILIGSCWTEAMAGTNGLGTALAAGRSVAVNGPEHYFFRFGEISCTAAPVRDAEGEIVGVLDASSYFESRQRHTQALVQMAATHIENGLLRWQMREHVVLALHPRAEYLGTLSAGLIAFSHGGRLTALNERARRMLAGLQTAQGTPFEALFDLRFEQALAMLSQGGELRLRDTMGSSLVAAAVGAPLALPGTALTRSAPPQPQAVPPQNAPRPGGTTPHPAPRRAGAAPPARPPLPAAPQDAQLCRALEEALVALRLEAPVLVVGETGSGKEVFARRLHAASGRRGAFVVVDAAALPHEGFEAALFGDAADPGLLAQAESGTLLLDAVEALPLPVQAALLRFVDDRTLRRGAGGPAQRIEVQLLATTQHDPRDSVAQGRLRADLLWRLDGLRVELPPLRQRSDLAALAREIVADIDPRAGLADDAVQRLAQQAWPGNVRELRSLLTRAVLGHGARRLTAADLDPLLPAARPAQPTAASALQQSASEMVLREFRRSGSVSETSRRLHISRTTVYRHLRAAGLAAPTAGRARGGGPADAADAPPA